MMEVIQESDTYQMNKYIACVILVLAAIILISGVSYSFTSSDNSPLTNFDEKEGQNDLNINNAAEYIDKLWEGGEIKFLSDFFSSEEGWKSSKLKYIYSLKPVSPLKLELTLFMMTAPPESWDDNISSEPTEDKYRSIQREGLLDSARTTIQHFFPKVAIDKEDFSSKKKRAKLLWRLKPFLTDVKLSEFDVSKIIEPEQSGYDRLKKLDAPISPDSDTRKTKDPKLSSIFIVGAACVVLMFSIWRCMKSK